VSVVHNNLSRQHLTESPPPAIAPPLDEDPNDLSESEREIARKERILAEGIRMLQDRVEELAEQLDQAQKELQQEREDNMRLRRGAMSDAMSPRTEDGKREPSLLSKALK